MSRQVAGHIDLAHVCAIAWKRSPLSRRRLETAGFGPGRWPDMDTLARMEPLDKRELADLQRSKPPFGGIIEPDARPSCVFLSPNGIIEPHIEAAVVRLADYMRLLGFGAGDVVLNGFSYHLTPAGLLFHGALLQAGCQVLPGGPQNTDALVELAWRAGATGFVGIASHLKVFVERAEHNGLKVGTDIPLRLALAGAEPFGSPVRTMMAERYETACFDFYGSADVGIVAGEHPASQGLALFDGVMAEVLDPDTGERQPEGEPGHLVLTVDNPCYPLIRFATGDICVLHVGRADQPPWIGPILGRVDGSVRVRGMLLHEGQVRQALAAHPAIAQGWLEVERIDGRDRLTARIAIDPASQHGVAEAVLRERFQSVCRLSLDAVTPADPADGEASLIRDRRMADEAVR